MMTQMVRMEKTRMLELPTAVQAIILKTRVSMTINTIMIRPKMGTKIMARITIKTMIRTTIRTIIKIMTRTTIKITTKMAIKKRSTRVCSTPASVSFYAKNEGYQFKK